VSDFFRYVLCAAVSGISTFSRVAAAEPMPIDQAVVRFYAPEAGGVERPQFVFQRELAFEARVEALSDGDRTERSAPYLDRHVRSALERHVAEELLAHLPMDPEPTPAEIAFRATSARDVLEQRVGGAERLLEAASLEGIGVGELDTLFRREARASLYLDRMVTPMLEPSDAELREVYRSGASPFRGRRFDEIAEPLRKWYVAQRLETALGNFFQNSRSRVHLTLIPH
jgi:hypothetical protein